MDTQAQHSSTDDGDAIVFRKPNRADGVAVWDLIAACPPLDRNSVYCNLLQCSDFAGTCVIAERNGQAVGWISAYRPPNDLETMFVWQVAVHETARGVGLAQRMLDHIVDRESARGVTKLRTTITEANAASWKMFSKFAKSRDAQLEREPWFEHERHFSGRHDTEHRVTIAPIVGGNG